MAIQNETQLSVERANERACVWINFDLNLTNRADFTTSSNFKPENICDLFLLDIYETVTLFLNSRTYANEPRIWIQLSISELRNETYFYAIFVGFFIVIYIYILFFQFSRSFIEFMISQRIQAGILGFAKWSCFLSQINYDHSSKILCKCPAY